MTNGHESSDISVKAVAVFALALAAGLALILAVMHPSRPAPVAPAVPTPGPKLQAHPLEDLAALRAKEDSMLKGYGWVDRKAGIIRIPIERAMELTVERGLPARTANGEVRP